jgi:ABC-type lipoprotein release transport system permease subunit
MKKVNLAAMAWRNLWRNGRRTLLTLASIALGGFIAVMFTAMQDQSFSDFIDTAARMSAGHVAVQHREYLDRPTLTRLVSNSEDLRQQALSDPDVHRVMIRITGQAMVASAEDNAPVGFIAFDPALEDAESLDFLDGLVEGKMFTSAQDRGIILGKELAKRLGVRLGDKVVYTLTDRRGDLVSGMGRLTGVMSLGTPTADGSICLLPIDTLREVLGYGPGDATRLAVFVSDSRRSAAVAQRLNARLPDPAVALTWKEVRPELSAFIAMKVGGARFMEAVILLLVIAGIFNTLFVSVMERSREFGIMLAIGFTRWQLFRLVLWESLWLGAVGLVVGAVVTAGPYAYLTRNGMDLSAMMGGKTTEVAGVGFDPLIRFGIFPENAIFIAAGILLATLLTGIYPAHRAGRLEPVQAIKLV